MTSLSDVTIWTEYYVSCKDSFCIQHTCDNNTDNDCWACKESSRICHVSWQPIQTHTVFLLSCYQINYLSRSKRRFGNHLPFKAYLASYSPPDSAQSTCRRASHFTCWRAARFKFLFKYTNLVFFTDESVRWGCQYGRMERHAAPLWWAQNSLWGLMS
jgi:hypothetical protein